MGKIQTASQNLANWLSMDETPDTPEAKGDLGMPEQVKKVIGSKNWSAYAPIIAMLGTILGVYFSHATLSQSQDALKDQGVKDKATLEMRVANLESGRAEQKQFNDAISGKMDQILVGMGRIEGRQMTLTQQLTESGTSGKK